MLAAKRQCTVRAKHIDVSMQPMHTQVNLPAILHSFALATTHRSMFGVERIFRRTSYGVYVWRYYKDQLTAYTLYNLRTHSRDTPRYATLQTVVLQQHQHQQQRTAKCVNPFGYNAH